MRFEKSLKKNAAAASRTRRFSQEQLAKQRGVGALTALAPAWHKASPSDGRDWRFHSVSVIATRRFPAMQYSAIILRAVIAVAQVHQ
jgi:hypothetical protein